MSSEFNELLFTEEEFYGLDILESPPDQLDDDLQYLHKDDLIRIVNTEEESNLEWNDRLISNVGEEVTFVLDLSRKEAWKLFKEEVTHLRTTIPKLLNLPPETSTETVTLEDLVSLVFGETSEFTSVFCAELELDRVTFYKFIANVCLQMAYRETPSYLYGEYSLLDDKTALDEITYMSIWKKIASLKRISLNDYVGSSRRDECLWDQFELAANKLLRKLSIVGRTDEISVALDDDKIWVQTSGRNEDDYFGLRKVTHVKDNRKGIVAHTAVSSTTNIPLAFMFERQGDRAIDCFTRIFSKLFPQNIGGGVSRDQLPDLSGVTNHSDRGYTLESTVFDFLLPAGAEFTNTAKRIMPFPFIWGMKTSDSDP